MFVLLTDSVNNDALRTNDKKKKCSSKHFSGTEDFLVKTNKKSKKTKKKRKKKLVKKVDEEG